MIHLIVGNTGSGKTTYSNKLKQETGGLIFSIDQWNKALFFPDPVLPTIRCIILFDRIHSPYFISLLPISGTWLHYDIEYYAYLLRLKTPYY